jgi:hypothetical protein
MTGAAIDPRVAKHGGSRANRKRNYEFLGMVAEADWRRTCAHKATRWYGCGLCGLRATSPHAIYTHLAKVHDR